MFFICVCSKFNSSRIYVNSFLTNRTIRECSICGCFFFGCCLNCCECCCCTFDKRQPQLNTVSAFLFSFSSLSFWGANWQTNKQTAKRQNRQTKGLLQIAKEKAAKIGKAAPPRLQSSLRQCCQFSY